MELDLPSKSELEAMMKAAGLAPKKHLGQNFLIDKNMLEHIAKLAGLVETDLVLEIGTGPGTLTQLLCEHAGHVVSVEIDDGLYEIARVRLAGFSNLSLLHCDALHKKSELHSELTSTLQQDRPGIQAMKFVANLPYAVATPLIIHWLILMPKWNRMVLTVQREFAEKAIAQPGTREYGPLAVLCDLTAEVKIERVLPSQVFWPAPKVESAIVVFEPRLHEGLDATDLPDLQILVRAWLAYRRKTIRKALSLSAMPDDTKTTLLAGLEDQGVDLRRRGDDFSPMEILQAYQIIKQQQKSMK